MQVVGSEENTSLNRRDFDTQLTLVICRIPWTLSVGWKMNCTRRKEFCQRLFPERAPSTC